MRFRTLFFTAAFALPLHLPLEAQVPLAERIGRHDPSQYRVGRSHGSVGDMHCMTLLPSSALNVNLHFLHRCQISPGGGGVGHHFHNNVEEMFVIFNGEAEFTVNGRTSVLRGNVGAPVRKGNSHAIYNPGPTPVEFMNINVSTIKGVYDAHDLGDPRVDVPKDEIPVFMTMRLDRQLLRPAPQYRGGVGVAQYRRALDHTVFLTNWAYVDHLLLPPGASEGLHRHRGVEEVYYVMAGSGEATVGGETAAITEGDAVPILYNQPHSFRNTGAGDLEFMIIGISFQPNVIDTELVQ